MDSAANASGWVQLCHDDDSEGYFVKTKDGDRFTLSFDELIRACRIADKRKEFVAQFSDFIERLDRWLESQGPRISRAFLTFGSGKIDLVVIQKSQEFEQELDSSLVSFDIEIARSSQFDLIRLDVTSLPDGPEESLRSFVPLGGGTLQRRLN